MIKNQKCYLNILVPAIITIFLLNITYVSGSPPQGLNSAPAGMAVYKDEAYPVYLNIEIESGNGTLSITGINYDDILYKSIMNGVYEAIFISGRNPYKYNYKVMIQCVDIKPPYLTGTSLSLLAYIMTLEKLHNTTLKNSVVITGTLNPDSTVGFVGKVYEKALGAINYNFTKIIYPELNDREYEIVTETVHIGPYAFKSKAIEVSPPLLENLTIESIGVSTGLDTWYLLKTGTQTYIDEILNKVPKTNETIQQSTVIEKYLRNIYEDTLKRYREAAAHIEQKPILLKYPALKSYFEKLFSEIDLLLSAFNNYFAGGYLLSASKYLSLGYSRVKLLEYIVKLLVNGNAGTDWVINDYLSIETRVYNSLIQIINRGVSPENLFLLTRAARLYYEARKYTLITLMGLDFITINNYYNRLEIKLDLIKRLSTSLMKLIECELIFAILAYDTGPRLSLEVLDYIGKALYHYAWFLTRYATRYSQITGVYSDIINYATGYIWNYKELYNNNGNKSIVILASLDYLIDSITHSQLYFNLHPGFEEIVESRFTALRRILPIYIESSRMRNSLSIQYNLERAVIYEDTPSKAALLERILAEIKAVILVKGALGSQSPYTAETYLSNIYSSINSIESQIYKELISDLTGIFVTSVILFGIFLILFRRGK